MKKSLLVLLSLFPFLAFAQPADSWFKIEVQFDFYGPSESIVLVTQTGDTLVDYQPSTNYEFYETVVFADSGDLELELLDTWGDGWDDGATESSVIISNTCQGVILDLDVDSLGSFSTYDTVVNLLPCPPPPCEITNTNVYQTCLNPGGQVLVVWEWQNGFCPPVNVTYGNEEGWGPFYQGVPPNATNYGMLAGNGQQHPDWEVEFYFQVEFADGTLSDTVFYTPTPCIEGCTDSTSEAYNPWATDDDGNCGSGFGGCDTATEYPITMEITLDQWPGETSWTMNSGGILQQVASNTYNFNDVGQTYTYNFCVSQTAGFELIVNDTYGDGMVGSANSGPGSIVIYDCSGDTIWEMTNPNFGSVLYSGAQYATACPTVPDVYGCTDPAYQEYNPNANIDDGSCSTLHVYGCMDTNSINYNPNATQQSIIPVCDYTLTLEDAGGDGWGNSYLGVAQNGEPIGTYTMGPGLYEETFQLQLETDKTVEVYYFEVGSPQSTPQQIQFQTWHNSFTLENADSVVLLQEGQNPFANNGQGALQPFEGPFYEKYVAQPFCGDSCIAAVYGCTDSTSLNYDPLANTDDGSCIPIIYGCMNSLAFNYDSTATVDDGSCVPVVVGCMDTTSYNYDPLANTPGACIPIVLGCTDPTSFNYNPNANTDDSSCVPVITGCTNSNSINYNPNANTDDGSCIAIVYGCTDPNSFNYDPLANVNQVSATDTSSPCVPKIYGCTDPTMYNYDPLANTDNGSCVPFIYGCTDSTMFNYDPLANTDNGSCIPFVYGCMDPNSFNYDPNANVNQVSATDFTNPCIPIVYGCTDSTAVNYDPNANVDNGSCITAIYGCTDPNAYNYDPNANVSDTTACLYDAGCYGGPGVPYWLNDPCYAWVIGVDEYCCTNDWDSSCQGLYDYCADGTGTTNITELVENGGLAIYPNPTETGLIQIDCFNKFDITIFNSVGQLITQEQSPKSIDLSNQPSGVYHFVITMEGRTISKKVIKQ